MTIAEITVNIKPNDRKEICEILERRANEVAQYLDEYRRDPKHFGSVELALSRDTSRLRRLAEIVDPEIGEFDD